MRGAWLHKMSAALWWGTVKPHKIQKSLTGDIFTDVQLVKVLLVQWVVVVPAQMGGGSHLERTVMLFLVPAQMENTCCL
jgi:hypothetical protein